VRQPLSTRPIAVLVGAVAVATGLSVLVPSLAEAAVTTPSAPVATSTTAAAPQPASSQELATGMMPADSPDAAPADGGALAARACAAGMGPSADPGQLLGLDVASYQHPGNAPIDWNAVAASGQRFVVVKATEATTYRNPYLTGDVSGARGAGMYAAAYHYARPGVSATDQADYFAQAYNGLGGTLLPPVLDLEENGGLGASDLINWTAAFLGRLQADTGRVPMIYTGPGFWNSSMGGTTAFGNYPLWIAHYTTCAQPQAFGGWSSWTFWQYSNGSFNSPPPVPGIGSDVDRNRSSLGEAGLSELAVGPFDGSASAAQFPDGSFVQVAGVPAIFEIAGLSPIWVTSWANVGGPRPVNVISAKTFSTLRPYPLDGTFVRAAPSAAYPSGPVYRIVGGAPVYVSSFAPFGAPRFTDIDPVSIAHAGSGGFFGQLRLKPADGTFVVAQPSGAVYQIVRGAPVYVSTMTPFGAPSLMAVNDATVANAGQAGVWSHLNYRPSDGTFVVAQPSGAVYQIVGGAPVYVSSFAPFGAPSLLTVNDAAVGNAGQAGVWSHVAFRPAEGTFLMAMPSGVTYRIDSSGAPIVVSSWDPYGGPQPLAVVNDATVANHGSGSVWAHLA